MGIIKKLKRKIVCGPTTKHRRLTSSSSRKNIKNATNNLPPIRFHSIHGHNVRISPDGSRVVRIGSFNKAIVFSNRPIKEKEKVHVKISALDCTHSWDGALKFGFTSINPSTYRSGSNLPTYVVPDMVDEPGSWAFSLPGRFAVTDTIVSFYYSSDGNIHYSVNGEDKGCFESSVSGSDVWAVIDVYGNTTEIEIIDARNHVYHQHNVRNQLRYQQSLTRRSQSISVLSTSVDSSEDEEDDDDDESENGRFYESMGRLAITPPTTTTTSRVTCRESQRDPLPEVYSKVNLCPLSFHRTRGINIRLSNDRCVAERVNSYNHGYTFSQRPLELNEKVVVQILRTDELRSGSLTFGLTTCDPSMLFSNELPEDSHKLLDRPEYWVVVKDVASGPQAGDELAFEMTEMGKVLMTKNKQPPITLMHIDTTQRFFCFFDLYGSTIKLKLLGTMKTQSSIKRTRCTLPPSLVASTSLEDLCYPPTMLYSPLNVNVHLYGKTNTKAKSSHSVTMMSRHFDYAVPNKRHVVLPPSTSCQGAYNPTSSTCSKGSSSGVSSILSSGRRSSSNLSVSNDCTVCFEAPVNTVLYMCGHMCMCHPCALKQWKNGGGQCPICRAHIRDVIRIYKS